MKQIKIALVLVVIGLRMGEVLGQDHFSSMEDRLSIGTAIVSQDPVPDAVAAYYHGQMTEILSAKGLASEEGYGRFCLVASLSVVSKNALPGPPTQIAQNINVTFYLVDNLEQKVFSSTNVMVKGVGKTEEQGLMNAVRSLNIRNQIIQQFVEQGKQKILEYYEKQSSTIIASARSLALRHQYEEALYMLTTIPMECKEAYSESLKVGNEVFQDALDYWCMVDLARARTEWAAHQNEKGAMLAGEYLSKIYPEASCYKDAMLLYEEIKGKISDDWRFEMKQYQDGVDLEQARINAWKEVGIAYGNHQPRSDYRINWLIK